MVGGEWGFKAQPKEPKQQKKMEGEGKWKQGELWIFLRRDSSQDRTFWQIMKSDREVALLQKPGVRGQEKTSWYAYTEELISYRPRAEMILKISW